MEQELMDILTDLRPDVDFETETEIRHAAVSV